MILFGLVVLLLALHHSDMDSWDLDTASSTHSSRGAITSDTRYSKRGLYDYHDVCIVGAGLSGSVIAERYANLRNQTSLIIERRDHIGGNCYDYIDKETGILVSKYGAHLFHTKFERVWKYVQQFSEWTPYEHEVVALIHGKHVPVPVNIDTVNALFGEKIKNSKEMKVWLEKEQVHYDHDPVNSEEMALSRVGQRLYELIFHPYTIKQWAKEPKELGPVVTARIPVRDNFDGRYFDDPHQALPSKGYTKIFEKMVMSNPLITMKLETDFFEVRSKLRCGKLYYTGPIDRYFADLGWDKLEYRSLDFERKVIKNIGHFQPKGVVNHPNATANFTRIVEYKHFLDQKSDHTILFYEHSKDGGEPYYPVPNPKNQELFQKYKDMANQEHDVTFVGRLANYKYFNMDQTIENALELFDENVNTYHVVVGQCAGDKDADLSWLNEWKKAFAIHHIYVYHTLPSKSLSNIPSDTSIVKASDSKKPAWKQHLARTDIEFASQTIFVDCDSSLKAIKKSLHAITTGQPTFVDYATLPYVECKTSKCGRAITGKDRQFFATHEAIKRYLGGITDLDKKGKKKKTKSSTSTASK